MNVKIVLRLESEGDGNKKKNMMKFFGKKNIITMKKTINPKDMYEDVDKMVNYVVK
jgi:uncharacterized protein Yka (UPF0111/DUF47 family)